MKDCRCGGVATVVSDGVHYTIVCSQCGRIVKCPDPQHIVIIAGDYGDEAGIAVTPESLVGAILQGVQKWNITNE